MPAYASFCRDKFAVPAYTISTTNLLRKGGFRLSGLLCCKHYHGNPVLFRRSYRAVFLESSQVSARQSGGSGARIEKRDG